MTSKKIERYLGEPLRREDFLTHFLVHCPKCSGRARVDVPHYLDFKHAVLKCFDCHFSEKAIDRMRFRSTAKARCTHCNARLTEVVADRKKRPTYVRLTCDECATAQIVRENWESYVLKYDYNGHLDAAFGLPLWLQQSVKGHVLWANNIEHLIEIQNYVAATLRERTTNRFKMTMVERLPEFVKVAKNRKHILSALEKMLQGA